MDITKTLDSFSHAKLKKLTKDLNLHVSIKGYTKLSKEELITELGKRLKYKNNKLVISIPESEISIPEDKPKVKKPTKQAEAVSGFMSGIQSKSAQVEKTKDVKPKSKKEKEEDILIKNWNMSPDSGVFDIYLYDGVRDIVKPKDFEMVINKKRAGDNAYDALNSIKFFPTGIINKVYEKYGLNKLLIGILAFTRTAMEDKNRNIYLSDGGRYISNVKILDDYMKWFKDNKIGDKNKIGYDELIKILKKESYDGLDDTTKKLNEFISNFSDSITQQDTVSAKNINQEKVAIESVETKKDEIENAIEIINTIQLDDNLDIDSKKEEIVSTLENLEITPVRFETEKTQEVNSNIDESFMEYTRQLLASFTETDLSELDEFSFKNNVMASIDDDGMIEIVSQPEDEEELIDEIQEAVSTLKKAKLKADMLFMPVEEEKSVQKEPVTMKNVLMSDYMDALNELDELSFMLRSEPLFLEKREQKSPMIPELATMIQEPATMIPEPATMTEKKQTTMMEKKPATKMIQDARQPGEGLEPEDIEDYITNLVGQPSRILKTPNEKHRLRYYDPSQIKEIEYDSVIQYLLDNVNGFKGLSKEFTKKEMVYINSMINALLSRRTELIKRRGRGRPQAGTSQQDIENTRRQRIYDTFSNMPPEWKSSIASVDKQVLKFMYDYSRYDAFENSYQLVDEEDQPYFDIVDLYYFNPEIEQIIEDVGITKDKLSNWIDLHIENKRFIQELNKLIRRAENIYKKNPKTLGQEATKIQSAVRGFLTRKQLERQPMEKSQVVKEKEETAKERFINVIKSGIPTEETLIEYLDTPKTSAKEVIELFKTNNPLAKKESNIKKLEKKLIAVKDKKAEELFQVEYDRKEPQYWRKLIMDQPYAPSGNSGKMYNLKKLYKKAMQNNEEEKAKIILEEYAKIFLTDKIDRLLINFNY